MEATQEERSRKGEEEDDAMPDPGEDRDLLSKRSVEVRWEAIDRVKKTLYS